MYLCWALVILKCPLLSECVRKVIILFYMRACRDSVFMLETHIKLILLISKHTLGRFPSGLSADLKTIKIIILLLITITQVILAMAFYLMSTG